MRITELFTAQSIALDEALQTQEQILSRLVELQDTHGNITDKEAYKKALYAREAEGTVTKKTDYALVNKLKADAEERTSQLRSLVEKMMTKQGVAIGTADSMWSFLAKGDFTVDEATRAQAQADIADDGYWGVDQTSDRILDFAKALSGNDPEKADLLLDAFKKGFKEATKSWGQDLPDISQRTYDAVVEKFNKWKNGTEETEAAQTQA